MNTCPVVFLHGWSCAANHFDCQVAAFSHQRSAVSLPWQSDLADHDAPVDLTVAVDFIESACLAEKFERPPILVGHSMGGMLAAMIAHRGIMPISAIVVIDATWPFDAASSDFFNSFIPELEKDFSEAIRRFFTERLFSPFDDPSINASIVEQVVQTDPEIAMMVFHDLQTPNRLPSAGDIHVPIMGISSSLQFLDRDQLVLESPHAWYGQIPGAGHFLMQQATHQLNAMLDRFFVHIDSTGIFK